MQYSGWRGGPMSGVMRYVLVLCAAISVIVAAVPAGAGAIRGVVVFTGAAEQKKLPVTIDQYICGKEKQAEDLLVGAQRGIRNAVVGLQTPPPAAHWPHAPVKAEFVRVDCELHSWMRAWVVVADHPFSALTGEAGEFDLPSVPPGKYTLQIWQETLGITTREVTVSAYDARSRVEH